MESETNNASQETELDRTTVETNDEMHNDIDRYVKDSSNSSDNVVMSARQFQELMSNVMKGFDNLNSRIESENTKLAASIKAVTEEMSNKIEIANRNLSDMLTKQFREEGAKLKEELSSKLKSEVLSLTEAINQIQDARYGYHKQDTDLEVSSLNHSVETACEKMNDRVNENMSVTQKQLQRVSQEMNTITRNLGADLAEHIT
jgi:hypothetical protein